MPSVSIQHPQPWRIFGWWLAGAAILLAALWAGPTAWADTAGTCGSSALPGTIPVPCGVDDGAGTAFQTAVTIDVLANDFNFYGIPLRIDSVTTPANGVAAINRATGRPDTLTYTPRSLFNGVDLFSYTLSGVQFGIVITSTAQVVVDVARPGEPPSRVVPFNPRVYFAHVFTQTTLLPDGSPVLVTTTVQIPATALTGTLAATDTLALAFTPVLSPTGPVDIAPPDSELAVAAALPQAYRYANLTFGMVILRNRQSFVDVLLAMPMTITVNYQDILLVGLEERTLHPYYWLWQCCVWRDNGIVPLSNDLQANRCTFTVDHVFREFSFFARPPLIYAPYAARD